MKQYCLLTLLLVSITNLNSAQASNTHKRRQAHEHRTKTDRRAKTTHNPAQQVLAKEQRARYMAQEDWLFLQRTIGILMLYSSTITIAEPYRSSIERFTRGRPYKC